jgi:succinate dehydrogenase / fumarate reductase iron-sulfur subunit
MNIDGKNRLACLTPIDDLKKGTSRITPLPHMPVLKDLVADLTGLYAQYESIEPWLQNDQPPPDRERRQSPEERAKLDELWSAFCAAAARPVPELLVESRQVSPARSVLLQSQRWLATAETNTGKRLDRLMTRPATVSYDHELHQYLPEGTNPAEAIGKTKRCIGSGRRANRHTGHPTCRRNA